MLEMMLFWIKKRLRSRIVIAIPVGLSRARFRECNGTKNRFASVVRESKEKYMSQSDTNLRFGIYHANFYVELTTNECAKKKKEKKRKTES